MRSFANLLLVLLAGCGFVRIAREPMESETYRALGPDKARGVIVLLPGFGDRPEAFAEHGFVAALEKTNLDVVAADAHFTYYRKGRVVQRLHEDVIEPLRKRGYRSIWLAGTSMGGIGAVGYARHHPESVRGLFLLAPYMGPKGVVKEVAAKGLCKWDGKAGAEDDVDSFAHNNFVWLREQACVKREVSLFLGVGSQDRLLQADSVLGGVIPASHFVVLPGGHGWNVWTPLIARLAGTAFDSQEVRY
ncbi:MAG TPA: alpha/beta hydrolase [Polyangiales bacterium]|nr:alpha/beta hydrolase [Polyangiales bacterium]